MAINVKIDPDIQHLIKGFEKGAKQFNSKSASKTKLKFAIDEKSFSRPLGKITGQVNMFESAMEAANARVIAFGASTAVLATVVKSLKDLVNVSIEVEAAFADINRILNLSGGNLDKFSNKLFDTAQKTASTFQAASSAALEFSRQGLKTEEVLKRTSDALTLVRLTGMNAKKSVDLLTATVNAFTDLDTTSAVDKFVAVETKFAVAARDLVEGLSRVGSAAVDAKVDFNELNALITAVQQTTGRGGAVIGNALKTIFTRLQRESTLEALERFNVTVRDVQGNILPATQVLDNFAGKYDKLADSTQAYLREQVAGVFQANILSAILKDLNKEQSTFSRALDVSVNATENAAQANEKLNQTMSALLQNTATEFAKLQKNLGDAAFLDLGKGIVGAMQTALKSLNSALDKDSTGAGAFFAQGFISGLSNVLQGPVLIGALQIILKVAKQSFTFLAQAIPTLLNITTQAQKRAQTEEFINNLLRSDVDLAKQIVSAEGNQSRQLELVLAKSRAITEQYQAQYRLSTSLGGAIVSGGSFITAAGVKGSTASKIKNKAGGYTPSINAEQSAINRGVGGAGGGAYPVVIPNFAFGGGNVGPVVANSSEVMVPNYGGSGGSAIFNQQMISQYGMPNGAVPIAAYGYNTKLSQVAKGNLKSISKTNKNINAKDRLKNGYDADFGLEGFPAFKDQSQYKSTKKYGEAFEDFVLNEFKTSLSGFHLIGSGKNWKSAHDFHNKDNSAIDLVKLSGGRITAMAEVKGGGLDKTQTLTKPSRFIGENLTDSRVGRMFRTPSGEDVKVKTLLITNLNKPANTSGIVKSANGYIPNFAAGRGTLSSTANPSKLKAAQAENPFINPLDTGKIGYDRHEIFKLKVRNKKGSTKKGGGKINNEYGTLAEKKALPFVKKLGYFPAKDVPGMHNKGSSAVDYIKTSNGLPTGGALTGVLELKAGDIKTKSMFKPLRSITENLHLPIVQNMFKKEGPENLKYESILATKPTARNPYKMTGMMRKGMGKGANMARGYVPNFAGGRQIKGYMPGTGNMPKGIQSQVKSKIGRLVTEVNEGIITMSVFNTEVKGVAKSAGIGKNSMRKFERQAQAMTANTQKANTASKGLAGKIKGLANSAGASIGLMMAAPMLAGFAEQTITGGKSRLDQTVGQRFAGSAVSNVTSFAASGAMIGGLPGAIVGGLIGFGKAAMDASLSLEELKEKVENYDKTTEQITSSADRYIKAQEDMASALSEKDYFDAQGRATKALEELAGSGSDLDQTFLSAQGDISQLTDSLKRYEQERGVASDIQRARVRAETYSPSFIDPKTNTQKEISKIDLERLNLRIKEMRQDLIAVMSEEEADNRLSKIANQQALNLGIPNQVLGSQGREKATSQFGFMAREYFPNITGGQQVALDRAAEDKGSKGVAEKMIEFSDKLNTEHMPMLLDFLNALGPSMEQIVSLFKFMSERLKQTSSLTPEQEKFFNSFSKIKDSVKLAVKEVDLAMRERDMAKEFADSMRKLQDSILDGINAPIEKFQSMRTQVQADFSKKVADNRDQFFKDNAAKYTDFFAELRKNQEGLKVLTRFQSALKAGEDISEFGPQMYQAAGGAEGPIAGGEKFLNNYNILVDAFNILIKGQENQKALNEERFRLEDIRARNTQAELEAQRQIDLMQSKRSLKDAQMGVARSAAERGFAAREFSLEMDPTLTGAEKTRRRMGIAYNRYRSNIDLTAQQRDVDLARIDEDKAAKVAEVEGKKAVFKESNQRLIGISDDYFNSIHPRFANQIADINQKAADKAEATRIKAGEDMDEFNADYKQENIRNLTDLKTRIPGFAAAGLGMTGSFNDIQAETETFSYRLGTEIPLSFQNNMVNALNTAMDKADDLGDALRNAAVGFLTEIRNAFTQQAVGQIMTGGKKMFDSFGPQGQVGGYIRAQNGMYISGGRTGDRNPALLEDGEYVLNRNAVKALGGPRSIDQLNFGMAPRFNSGGSVFLNKDVMSDNMSGYFLTGDNPELAERRKAIEDSLAAKAAKKAKNKQFVNALISTLAMGAVSGAMSRFGSNKEPVELTKTGNISLDVSGQRTADQFNKGFSYSTVQRGGYMSRGPRNTDSIPAFMAGGEYVMNNRAVKKYGLGFMSRLNGGYIPKYQNGGSVAETSANSLGNMGSNTNNVSINVNMGASSQAQGSNASVNSQGGAKDIEQSKELGKRIENAVLQVIQKEQRVGGILSGGNSKRG